MSRPPSLFESALLQCQRFATSITDIGDLPYNIVKPWSAKVSREQSALIEERSPHIIEESDESWKDIIAREFKDRKLPQSHFREAYYAFQRDKQEQLGQARERSKMKQEQYNQNKRASSVVALSEADSPLRASGGATPTFRSSLMRSVVKKSQATAGMFGRNRAPLRLVPASTRRAASPPVPPTKYPLIQSPSFPAAARSPRQSGSPPISPPPQQFGTRPQSTLPAPAPQQVQTPAATPSSRQTSPERSVGAPYRPTRRPDSSIPPAKRKRVASVFMPRR